MEEGSLSAIGIEFVGALTLICRVYRALSGANYYAIGENGYLLPNILCILLISWKGVIME